MNIIKNIKLIPKILELLKNITDKLENIHESIYNIDKHVISTSNKNGQDSNINFHNISNRIQKNEKDTKNILSNINYSLEKLANEIPLDTSINEDWLKAKENGIVYMINKNIESLGYSIGVNKEGEAIIINFPIKLSIEDDKLGLSKYIKFLDSKINKERRKENE